MCQIKFRHHGIVLVCPLIRSRRHDVQTKRGRDGFVIQISFKTQRLPVGQYVNRWQEVSRTPTPIHFEFASRLSQVVIITSSH
jgi:hypothetical protein